MNKKALRIYVPGGPLEMHEMLSDALVKLGFDSWTEKEDRNLNQVDVIIFISDTVGLNLLERYNLIGSRRPIVILWLVDPLPPPDLSEKAAGYALSASKVNWQYLCGKGWGKVIHKYVPFARNAMRAFRSVYIHRLAREMTSRNPAYGDCPAREWNRVVRRYRIFTDYMNQGLIDYVFTTTVAKKEFIIKRGFHTEFIPFGYHSIFGQLQGRKRDIDVLFLGRLNNERRRRVIDQLFDELRANGVVLTVIDRDYYTEGRTELLNRTKIMLNLLRVPWDFGPERCLMSMSCGALVVSEKIMKPEPYQPGVHFAQAETPKLASIICQYLENDNEREKITRSAYEFVTSELQLKKSVLQLLKRCLK